MNIIARLSTFITLVCFLFSCLLIHPSLLMAEETLVSPLRQSENTEPEKTEKQETEKQPQEKKEQQADKNKQADKTDKTQKTKTDNKKKSAKSKTQTVKKQPSFLDNLFDNNSKKQDNLKLDSAKQAKKEKGKTPFYKHWIFWTVIGAAAVTGTVLGLKYGVDKSNKMSFDIERR